jgi:hypothetical protein
MERKIEIGDFVKYRKYRGQVIEITDPYTCPYTGAPEPGSITIITKTIITKAIYEFMDYHYVFELDREKMREEKLKVLGIL